MLPTDLTVATIVERDGRYLIVEERSSGRIVITQPGGHIEAGESPEQAAERETLEETGCVVSVTGMVGVYLWIHPQTRQQFLRVVYTADFVYHDVNQELDDGIDEVHWMTLDELRMRKPDLRTPIVLRCLDDLVAGQRHSTRLLRRMRPIDKHVDAVIAKACLV